MPPTSNNPPSEESLRRKRLGNTVLAEYEKAKEFRYQYGDAENRLTCAVQIANAEFWMAVDAARQNPERPHGRDWFELVEQPLALLCAAEIRSAQQTVETEDYMQLRQEQLTRARRIAAAKDKPVGDA